MSTRTFLRTGMPAILIEDDARSWYESGVVRDMTIRNNKFIHCAESVISIDPKASDTSEPTHKNIRILNNEFHLSRGHSIIHSKNVQGLIINGNTIHLPKNRSRKIESLIHLQATLDCVINNNKIILNK